MGWFSDRVVDWQRVHGRHDLPWQRTDDPYRIWISEIMLQQTQVAAVIPFYLRFIDRFPDVSALAAATPDEVMRLWSGLGYYGRARNLLACARRIVEQFDGEFPRSAEVLAGLPGIGRSTAAAIAAFAFGERVAILDGNVKRVLCRFEGVEGFPGVAAIERRLWEIAERELPAAGIQGYTQGLMDLGATHCSRRKPACDRCPLAERCVARAQGRVAELPTPRPRRTLPVRETAMLVLRRADEVLLERRAPTGVWGGLWSLPEVQGSSSDSVDAALLSRFGVDGGLAQRLAGLRARLHPLQVARAARVCVEVDARRCGRRRRARLAVARGNRRCRAAQAGEVAAAAHSRRVAPVDRGPRCARDPSRRGAGSDHAVLLEVLVHDRESRERIRQFHQLVLRLRRDRQELAKTVRDPARRLIEIGFADHPAQRVGLLLDQVLDDAPHQARAHRELLGNLLVAIRLDELDVGADQPVVLHAARSDPEALAAARADLQQSELLPCPTR